MTETEINSEEVKPQELSIEDKQKDLERLQNRVGILLDELKSLFIPAMKITFIARHSTDKNTINILTEETDLNALADHIREYHSSLKPINSVGNVTVN